MGCYYLILCTIILLGLLKISKVQTINFNYDKVILPIISFILFLFAALRNISVGADTRQYTIIYQLAGEEKWENLWNSNASYLWFKLSDIEIGYKFINKAIYTFFRNPQTITVFNSFVLILVLFLLIKKYSNDWWLSVFLYFALGFYQLALNLTPSAIASLIVLCGVDNIQKRDFLKYLIYVAMGTIFHYSAIIFLIAYPVCILKLNKRRFWLLLGLSFFIITIFYTTIVRLISPLVPKQYQMYLVTKERNEALFVYLVQLILIVFCLIINKDNQIYSKYSLYLWLFLLESVSYFISIHSTGFTRVAFLFSPIKFILIPNLISDKLYIKKKFVIELHRLIVVLYSFFAYIFRVQINNIGTTIPYLFFWQ